MTSPKEKPRDELRDLRSECGCHLHFLVSNQHIKEVEKQLRFVEKVFDWNKEQRKQQTAYEQQALELRKAKVEIEMLREQRNKEYSDYEARMGYQFENRGGFERRADAEIEAAKAKCV